MSEESAERRRPLTFWERFTPPIILQIGLLLIAIIGGWFNFEYRIRRLEEMQQTRQEITDTRLNELQRRDLLEGKLGVIDGRLARIERKLKID